MRARSLRSALLKILIACGVATALFIYLTLPILSHAIGQFLQWSQRNALDRTHAIFAIDSAQEWATQSTGSNNPERALYYRDGAGLLLTPPVELSFTFKSRCMDTHYLNVAALAENTRLNVWINGEPTTSLSFERHAVSAIVATSTMLPPMPLNQDYYVTVGSEQLMHLDGVSVTCEPRTTPWWINAFARFTQFEPYFKKNPARLNGWSIRYDEAREWERIHQSKMDFEFRHYYSDGQGVSIARGASIRIPAPGCTQMKIRLGAYASFSFPLEIRSGAERLPVRFENQDYQLVVRDLTIRKQRNEDIEIFSPDYSHVDFIGLRCQSTS